MLRKQFQKSLTKQGIKFKLSTKVLSAEKKDGKVIVTTEAAKDGKQDSVRLLFFSPCARGLT
jgi:dihydrolipoamide dehydrogenase